MTRLALKTIGLGTLIAFAVACGDNKPPPKEPEQAPMTDDAGALSTSTDTMDAGAATASTDSTPPPPAAPAALALPSGSAKLKFKTTKAFDIELKSDGTVNSGGKAAAKIAGTELQTPDGKSTLKVDGDGNITTADGNPYAKFDGDDLTTQTAAKWSIGEDGAFTQTDDKGKKSNLGKADGVGSAKKATLLAAAYVAWGTKAPAAKGAKPAGDKPAGKPAGKPGAKPTTK